MNNPEYPQRIVSLVPSLTELLVDLGLQENMVGRTRFCIHPEGKVDEIPKVGGTKNPRIDKIKEAEPDWVLANKEENEKQDIEEIRRFTRVTVSEISTVEQALNWIEKIGTLTGTARQAKQISAQITQLLNQRGTWYPKRTIYYIWKDPWMSVGGDTYISDIMSLWGMTNLLSGMDRYPELSLSDLTRLQPELILLSSEPYPFKQKHVDEVRECCRDAEIKLVDGEWFSWYGSRMVTAFGELNNWRDTLTE